MEEAEAGRVADVAHVKLSDLRKGVRGFEAPSCPSLARGATPDWLAPQGPSTAADDLVDAGLAHRDVQVGPCNRSRSWPKSLTALASMPRNSTWSSKCVVLSAQGARGQAPDPGGSPRRLP